MAAKAFMEQMWLDLLYLIPAGIPPHKQVDGGADPWQRLRMCELAMEGVDGVIISDMEIRRGGKSYTVDTLRALSNPDDRLFLLKEWGWRSGGRGKISAFEMVFHFLQFAKELFRHRRFCKIKYQINVSFCRYQMPD